MAREKKLLAQLNSDNGWSLASQKFRKHMSTIEAEDDEREKAKIEEASKKNETNEEIDEGLRTLQAKWGNDTSILKLSLDSNADDIAPGMPELLLRASSPGTSKQVKASKATTSLETPELEDLRNKFIIRATLASTTTHPSTTSPPKPLPSTPNPTVANTKRVESASGREKCN
ncbi:MAG: hypothetical protein ASARMPRED_000942 [Alectoria sarmentosa]|nr:MAG: hypothetical protein ASARMPRED_000942 [Alectoria sarmentosa]